MKSSRFAGMPLLVSLVALALSACGAGGFEPASKIKGLRVLAIQKDRPYPHVDDGQINLKVLYWDGASTPDRPRNVSFNFLPCYNPPGDLYYNCFSDLTRGPGAGGPSSDAGAGGDVEADAGPDAAEGVDAAGSDAASSDAAGGSDAAESADAPGPTDAAIDGATDAAPGGGGGLPPSDADHIKTFSFPLVADNLIRPKAPGITDYGLVYVLFTACAGHLEPTDPGSAGGLQLGCFDDARRRLGPDDFVPGYASLYAYRELRNANPIVDDFSFKGASFKDTFAAPDADVPHIARCTEGDRGNCPAFDLKLNVNRASAEIDPLSTDPNGAPLQEQIWVAFYSTDGDFTSSLRLVNDATRGWNDDNGTKFRAPPTPGAVRLFAVVHDNRGGVEWALGKVIVD